MQMARKALMQKLESDENTQAPNLAALNVRTSMRNQLPCTIRVLKKQGASIRVELALADGSSLHSRITRESAELLELKAGMQVLALCKATAVGIVPAAGSSEGNNVLQGSVSRATPKDQEVALKLESGLQLVGFAGAGHGFKPGMPARAELDEAAIVIAVTR
jgi:molybdate transport system regulatory protein